MRKAVVTSIASFAALAATTGFAQAEPKWCTATVAGTGRANIEEPLPEQLACLRARLSWAAKVRDNCPSRSPWWWRARYKHYIRDQGAGQRTCTAVGGPVRKIF